MFKRLHFMLVSLLVISSETFSSSSLSRKVVQKRSSEEDMRLCVAHINILRARHGAPPLTWGKYEARDASQWANYLNEMNKLEKDPQTQTSDPEGELLVRISSDGSPAEKCIAAVNQWYSQLSIYKSAGGCDSDNGVETARDFSQLVWKSSHSIGISVVGDIVDVRFFPPGNFEDEFAYDVEC